MTDEEARAASNLMTVKEVAAGLRVAPMTVYRLINKGLLGALRIGGDVKTGIFRVPEAEFQAYKRRAFVPASTEGGD